MKEDEITQEYFVRRFDFEAFDNWRDEREPLEVKSGRITYTEQSYIAMLVGLIGEFRYIGNNIRKIRLMAQFMTVILVLIFLFLFALIQG